MSDITITVQKIAAISAHPNADRLDIAKILGTQCVVPKSEFAPGQKVIYFPPNMLIPEDIAEELGVKKYLKHVIWNGKRVQSRIAACRLRGEASFGFVVPIPAGHRYEVDTDLTGGYMAEKYEPPPVHLNLPGIKGGGAGLAEGEFFKYTNIQNFWNHPNTFQDDDQVVITEKIHGTNSRIGVLFEDGEWVYATGSHKCRWMDVPGVERYWKPLRNQGMLEMLAKLCGEKSNVIVYGEIFGSSVQDMDYGFDGDTGYRVFDISINGQYMDWVDVQAFCYDFDVPTVPVIYWGPWDLVSEMIDEYASGRTSVGTPVRKFKGREGVVIKLEQEQTGRIGGWFRNRRTILKYISADYLDRKGAQDNA
jgi:RNA ligase (TIGR02306 family)